jgi:hypothetical protein
MKDLLLESPDTLVIKDPTGKNEYTKRYGYLSNEVVCSFIIFDDDVINTTNNFLGAMSDEGKLFPVIELWDPVKNEAAAKFMKNYVSDFNSGRKGHSDLETVIYDLFRVIYGKENLYSHYSEGPRGRIFKVDGKYYFTVWGGNTTKYKTYMPVFVKIVKACNLDPTEIIWEWKDESPELDYQDRNKLISWAQMLPILGNGSEPEPNAAAAEPNAAAAEPIPQSEPKAAVEVESELKKKIKELMVKQSELEADSHVKGATWSESEKNRYKLTMLNLDSEIKTLAAAEKAGETDVSKVIIKTIDSLEGQQGDVVPADILYAELERKLSKYGNSAVAIIRNLRDRGIDIKKALREIHIKHGDKVSSSQLMESLSGYLKESDSSVEVFSGSSVDKAKNMTSVDDFLELFVGHKLETLMDKLSFSRLYVMNKFDYLYGDDPQQKMVTLLEAALTFINFRMLDPLRKKVDDDDATERKNPEYQKHHVKKMALLKAKFVAQRSGDANLIKKITDEYNSLEEFPTSYSKNMEDMDSKRKLIWATPLSEKEVLPSTTDSSNDKKRYEAAKTAFEKFKRESE